MITNTEVRIAAAEDRAQLTTTLDKLRSAGASANLYMHVLNCLDGVELDHGAPINLLTILQHHGANDCIWALRATECGCERQARLIAADCAETALHLFEQEYPGDNRPRRAIEAARVLARGEASDAAWTAARDAANDAVRAAAMAGASDAASDAAWIAAMAAASDAASDAAWTAARAATSDQQADIIRRYLSMDSLQPSPPVSAPMKWKRLKKLFNFGPETLRK